MKSQQSQRVMLAVAMLAATGVAMAAAGPLGQQNQVSEAAQLAQIERALGELPREAAKEQPESYQRIYEAFTRLTSSVSSNSLANMRRLVDRLNVLVGQPSPAAPAVAAPASSGARVAGQSVEDKTEQALDALDKMQTETNEHTLRQLGDDVSRLMQTINESYLRNIRRLVERVNKVVGEPAKVAPRAPAHSDAAIDAVAAEQRQSSNDHEGVRVPGFPGWDELITAVDRMQKSFAQFVRSSTRLVTSG